MKLSKKFKDHSTKQGQKLVRHFFPFTKVMFPLNRLFEGQRMMKFNEKLRNTISPNNSLTESCLNSIPNKQAILSDVISSSPFYYTLFGV